MTEQRCTDWLLTLPTQPEDYLQYLTEQLWRIAQKPSRAEFLRRLRQDPPTELGVSAADVIREMRGPLP